MKLAKILSNLCFYFWFTITSAQSLSLPLDSVLQPNFFIQHSPTLVPNCSSGSGINFGNYVNCQLCQLFEELNSHWEIFYRVTASQSFYNFSSQWSWAGWALLHWQNIWNDAAWRCVHNIFGHLIIFFPHPGYGLTSEYCVDLVQDDGDQLSVLALKCFPALGPASCEEAGDKVGNTHFNTTLTQSKRGKWTLMCWNINLYFDAPTHKFAVC